MPHLRHADSHVNDMQKMVLDLGANDHGAETCNLGANCNGVEIRVYFLKGYYQGRICENLSKRAKNIKKSCATTVYWVTLIKI
jgi:hypothetical protein